MQNPKLDKVYIVTYQPEKIGKHEQPIDILSVFSNREGAKGFVVINAREFQKNIRDYNIIEEDVYIAAVSDENVDPINLTEGQINDRVELWHTGISNKPLHEFLGMTWKEYGVWVKDPSRWRNENKKCIMERSRKISK